MKKEEEGEPKIFHALKHPEAAKDEVFFGNVFVNESGDSVDTELPILEQDPEAPFDEKDTETVGYSTIGWQTKRLGQQAYKNDGSKVDGLRPVFVKKSELEREGFTIVE